MFSSVIHYFYPDIPQPEIRKFSLLSITAFLIIGTYWLLRILKNTIFYKIAFPESLGWLEHQGRLFQPTAKFWSVFVVIGMVLIYSKLVDLFKKHQLFYIICSFYAVIFGFTALTLFFTEVYGPAYVGKIPLAAAGWLSYFAIESFGSLTVALFWSFTNSITDTDSAKKAFPLIITVMQIGAIIGSSIMLFSPSVGVLWPILSGATVMVMSIIPLIAYFTRVIPAHDLVGNKRAGESEKKKDGFFTGFISGLVLLLTRPYMLGIFIVSNFYEIVGQVLDYQMRSYAAISPLYSSATAFGQFESIFGVCTNVASFLISLLGTSYIIKKLGIRISLFIYPVVVSVILCGIFGIFMTHKPDATTLLWIIFAGFMIIKALGYAVNNPIKEILYIPTSKDVKFKAKGWSDMFGGRFSKGAGAHISHTFKENLNDLMVYGTFVSSGLIGVWAIAALYVGYKNQQLIKDNKIIE